jgi:hypothetical protein
MSMGDDGPLRPAIRVDMKAAWPAIEALGVHGEPRIETFGLISVLYLYSK